MARSMTKTAMPGKASGMPGTPLNSAKAMPAMPGPVGKPTGRQKAMAGTAMRGGGIPKHQTPKVHPMTAGNPAARIPAVPAGNADNDPQPPVMTALAGRNAGANMGMKR